MTVLLSIKKKWWDKIVSGKKNVEVRNTWNSDIKRIIFYESAPIKKVVGEASCMSNKYPLNYDGSIDRIHKLSNDNMPFKSAIRKKEFQKYVYMHDFTWIIFIYNLKIYKEPKELIDYGYKRPPQNYFIYSDKVEDHRNKTRIRQLIDNNKI